MHTCKRIRVAGSIYIWVRVAVTLWYVKCAGSGGAGASAVLAALGKRFPAAETRLDSGRGGTYRRRTQAFDLGTLRMSIHGANTAREGTSRSPRVLSSLRSVAEAARYRLM